MNLNSPPTVELVILGMILLLNLCVVTAAGCQGVRVFRKEMGLELLGLLVLAHVRVVGWQIDQYTHTHDT